MCCDCFRSHERVCFYTENGIASPLVKRPKGATNTSKKKTHRSPMRCDCFRSLERVCFYTENGIASPLVKRPKGATNTSKKENPPQPHALRLFFCA